MNTFDTEPSLFDSFNARFVDARILAQSFTPSPNFDKLCLRSHSIVVGPRGSGKTSLLKMLQTQALESWTHARANEYRHKIDFSGVFIGTDKSWSGQLDHLGKDYLDDKSRERLSVASFTTHVLHSLVLAFQSRIIDPRVQNPVRHRRVEMRDKVEIGVVRTIARAWYLRPATDTFKALKQALTLRQSKIFEIATEERYHSPNNRDERLRAHSFLHLHFLRCVSLALEIFDDAINQPEGRWALLFDELELAPKYIIEDLMTSLRSIDQKLLIKLSLSPFDRIVERIRTALSAMSGHDYNEIPLWYAHKEQGFPFGRELLNEFFKRNGINTPVKNILGRSDFDSDPGTAYSHGSRHQAEFKTASLNDPSFARYIKINHIHIDALHVMKDSERAALVRKIYPIILLRNFFRLGVAGASDHEGRQRSRKSYTIYAGANGILAMTEANPRWLIGIAHNLLAYCKERSVSKAAQMQEVRKMIERFRALLKIIPCSETIGSSKPVDLLELLDVIGDYFYQSVIRAPFTSEPYSTFIVDEVAAEKLSDTLAVALNNGAIVHIPEKPGEVLLNDFTGKRFRLSYLLSPYYKIPIRLGAAVALSRILSSKLPQLLSGTSSVTQLSLLDV